MKKILFALLILMVGVFAISAAPTHYPGGVPLEIAISDGYGVATPDTVLAVAPPSAAVQGSVIHADAVIPNNSPPAWPQDILMVFTLETGQIRIAAIPRTTDFYLLC